MSLEAAVAENTAALKLLTAAVLESNSGRAAAVESIAAVAGRPAGSRAKKTDAAATVSTAAIVAANETAKPAETPKPAAAAKAEPTPEDLRNAAQRYLKFLHLPEADQAKVTDEQKAPRKAFVKAIVQHLSLDLIVNAKPEDRAKIIGWLEASAAGKAVDFDEGQDDHVAEEPTVEEEDDDDVG